MIANPKTSSFNYCEIKSVCNSLENSIQRLDNFRVQQTYQFRYQEDGLMEVYCYHSRDSHSYLRCPPFLTSSLDQSQCFFSMVRCQSDPGLNFIHTCFLTFVAQCRYCQYSFIGILAGLTFSSCEFLKHPSISLWPGVPALYFSS